MSNRYTSAALERVADYIAGAKLDRDQVALDRYFATRAFLTMVGDPRGGAELLATAAFQILSDHPRFGEHNNLEARIALLGLPLRAPTVSARLILPPRPSAELVTTKNLAALLSGTPPSAPIPGRRTDVAAAILAGHRPPLTRLIRADEARLRALGNRYYEQPDHWYPVFAGLLVLVAGRRGMIFPPPQPQIG